MPFVLGSQFDLAQVNGHVVEGRYINKNRCSTRHFDRVGRCNKGNVLHEHFVPCTNTKRLKSKVNGQRSIACEHAVRAANDLQQLIVETFGQTVLRQCSCFRTLVQ